jgi:hypothetical protein
MSRLATRKRTILKQVLETLARRPARASVKSYCIVSRPAPRASTHPSCERVLSDTSRSASVCSWAGTSVDLMPRVSWRSSGCSSVFCVLARLGWTRGRAQGPPHLDVRPCAVELADVVCRGGCGGLGAGTQEFGEVIHGTRDVRREDRSTSRASVTLRRANLNARAGYNTRSS